ncbi:ThuA domain-containing protein [Paenibacillus kobensis]|uniref:ThuA domain-containing protein n=1 Tax=Paenibacillus kobensis TaxID=59841 RepID=UPI000FDC9E71|nr:ThuA domain-containing protein [Paenibacillus kobensis]
MRKYSIFLLVFILLSSIGIVTNESQAAEPAQQPASTKVLLFTKTEEFRHDSIPTAIETIKALGKSNGFEVEATEDSNVFTDQQLSKYKAVVFLLTTGDVLNESQQAAFERYIKAGNGYVGVHAAADTEYGWKWYGGLVGAYLKKHPVDQKATVIVDDRTHPSTSALPLRWERTDEWYDYQLNPRGNVHVLARVDEGSYSGGTMGADHPISWCSRYSGGRSWYTGGGHTAASFTEPLFQQHLLGGIEYAAGLKYGDCDATVDRSFEKVVLDNNTTDPIQMSFTPDGRLFYIERNGAIKLYNPKNSTTKIVGKLNVSVIGDDGLMSGIVDPQFERNHWFYILYSPAGEENIYRVSRFVIKNDKLDKGSEKVILRIPIQRTDCCHGGGGMVFDSKGNLYIPIGDNSNPFFSDGYAPLDERPGQTVKDSQHTAANSFELRGKILRIKPTEDGSYTIPAGNLFPADGKQGRPEIYIMGVRNPFRISIDMKNDRLYFGDVGPDANTDDPNRGPKGYDEWNYADSAGNYGWPYCIADNKAYRDFNFATRSSGGLFDCSHPVNDSPNNTGARELPAAKPAWIWYPYGNSTEFPQLTNGTGRTAMAGPIYRFNPKQSDNKLPRYYNNSLFMYDFSRGWIKEVRFDEQGKMVSILPFLSSMKLSNPVDIQIGPDGAMYVLDYGAYGTPSEGKAQLVKIRYTLGVNAPVAVAKASVISGKTPLTVKFSSEGSYDPDGDKLTYMWSFTKDKIVNSKSPNPTFTFRKSGNYVVKLKVFDSTGRYSIARIPITVGNTAPSIRVEEPVDGGFFEWGEQVDYRIKVTDAEDGSTTNGRIPCSSVTVDAMLGHDQHTHTTKEQTGCTGQFTALNGHSEGDNLFYVVNVSYTDKGAAQSTALTATRQITLQPKRKQAEHYTSMEGAQLRDVNGIKYLGFIDHGDWISYSPVNLKNISSIQYRVASAGTGGFIEARLDAQDGPLIANVAVPITGGWQNFVDISVPITASEGTHELFFVFKNHDGDQSLFNLDWVQFNGAGISHP